MITYLDQFAAHLGKAEDAHTSIVGPNLYVRYANDPAIFKITTRPAVGEDVEITLQLIHPEHGPIDSASFTLTRSQEFDEALQQLEAYQDVWMV